jgi:hypothetical protein
MSLKQGHQRSIYMDILQETIYIFEELEKARSAAAAANYFVYLKGL